MKPLVEGLQKDYTGKVEFALNNLEKGQGEDLASKHRVQYVPTFVFVNSDGSVAKTLVGEQTEQVMRQALDALR